MWAMVTRFFEAGTNAGQAAANAGEYAEDEAPNPGHVVHLVFDERIA